jgi:predicted nucleic acid-binding Zn ribbon protein
MERAARVIGKLRVADDESLARAAWPIAVGKRIADRSTVVNLVGSRLVLQVEDSVWQSQLYAMRGQILARIEQTVGRRLVESLEFKVAVPRPKPQRTDTFALATDEADRIASPALRRIYKASRRKAVS